MGTSKSYISLKTPKHTSAKRGLTSYLSGGGVSKADVVSRYATAVKSEGSSSASQGAKKGAVQNYGIQLGKMLSFISGVQSGGLSYALLTAKIDTIPKTPYELYDLLSSPETTGTIDEVVMNKAWEVTLELLQITDFDLLAQMDLAIFSKVIIANIIAISFEQRYFEQIQDKSKSIEEAQRRCKELKDYIYAEITTNLDTDKIKSLSADLTKLSVFVEEKCNEAYDILIKLEN